MGPYRGRHHPTCRTHGLWALKFVWVVRGRLGGSGVTIQKRQTARVRVTDTIRVLG